MQGVAAEDSKSFTPDVPHKQIGTATPIIMSNKDQLITKLVLAFLKSGIYTEISCRQ